LVAGLTAGGIAGVVVAGAIVAGITVGGGSYAVANTINDGDDGGMNTNPLFEGSGQSGVSAVYSGGA